MSFLFFYIIKEQDCNISPVLGVGGFGTSKRREDLGKE
jgi:hypothetical protein